MRKAITTRFSSLILLTRLLGGGQNGPVAAEETLDVGRTTDANKERLVLDDMEDVADWYNGSPEETRISTSARAAGTSSVFAGC
ncbi:MAG: hypothetical protein ACYTG0_16265 [Planctomycetota bacterium]|jgi:hypothetical protein